MSDFIKKAKAVVIGHAIGDALGVPVEFRSREYLDENPITDMIGYGTYPVPKGAWSDDTSMSLCALECIFQNIINLKRTMQNFYLWLYMGAFTPFDKPFDVGNTCREAIDNFVSGRRRFDKCGLNDEYSNGNGSLMRIHPFALAKISSIYLSTDYEFLQKVVFHIKDVNEIRAASTLTHAHPRSRLGCILYYFILSGLFRNPCKESVMQGLKQAVCLYNECHEYEIRRRLSTVYDDFVAEEKEFKAYSRLFNGIEKLPRESIKSDGYVVHTLEAAVWCLLTTDSYKECVLKAVNLGNDTDTTAAVAGGFAGALYGYNAIPQEWKDSLIKREYIEELCEKAFNDEINFKEED